MNPGTEELAERGNLQVQEVLKAAQEHLRQLIRKRAEIVKRIGTVKQTIVGLANLFGSNLISGELRELVGPKGRARQRGFTKSCRTVLMEANRPLGANEVCEQLQRRIPLVLLHHKDPVASVTTVLNRLVEYGEALPVHDENGRWAWQWCSQGRASASAPQGDRSVSAM
ncbi:MAG: hypothetical protein WB660_29225 [Candidatus Sulfotelmatobacter sp.]